jgi:hypothetical protein
MKLLLIATWPQIQGRVHDVDVVDGALRLRQGVVAEPLHNPRLGDL